MSVGVRAYVRACVRACVRASERGVGCVRLRAFASHVIRQQG